MPRLDAERLSLWRDLVASTARLQRAVEVGLVEECDVTLEQFEVLGALQRGGGSLRLHELTDETAAVHSSMVRRLDRLEERGLVERRRGLDPSDGRAVVIVLTRFGREIWRDANVLYRRAVQAHFARHLTDTDLHALWRIVGKVGRPEPL